MNRRSFLTALVGLPFLPSALAALPAPVTPGTYGAIERAAFPFWSAQLTPGTGGVLTLKMVQDALDRIARRESLGAGTYYLHYAPR